MLQSHFESMSRDMRSKMQAHMHSLLKPEAAMQQELAEMQAHAMEAAASDFTRTNAVANTKHSAYEKLREEVRVRHAQRMQRP
jgi:hypothetical protein